jgi:hypothetical protein
MDCRRCNWYLCETCHPREAGVGADSLWDTLNASLNTFENTFYSLSSALSLQACTSLDPARLGDDAEVIEEGPAQQPLLANSRAVGGTGAAARRGGQRLSSASEEDSYADEKDEHLSVSSEDDQQAGEVERTTEAAPAEAPPPAEAAKPAETPDLIDLLTDEVPATKEGPSSVQDLLDLSMSHAKEAPAKEAPGDVEKGWATFHPAQQSETLAARMGA